MSMERSIISRSMPYLPRYRSVSAAPRAPQLWPMIRSRSQPCRRIAYFQGTAASFIAHSRHHSPSPQRVFMLCINGKTSNTKSTLSRTSRSRSYSDLYSSHIYTTMEPVGESEGKEPQIAVDARATSCGDIYHKGPFFPDATSQSESGVSLNDSSSCFDNDNDNMSQLSFGSSSAFHEMTIDSELDRLDSEDGSGNLKSPHGDQWFRFGDHQASPSRNNNRVNSPSALYTSKFSTQLNVLIPAPNGSLAKDKLASRKDSTGSGGCSTPLAQSTPHVSPRSFMGPKLSIKGCWDVDDPDNTYYDSDSQASRKLDESSCYSSLSEDNVSDVSIKKDKRKVKLTKKRASLDALSKKKNSASPPDKSPLDRTLVSEESFENIYIPPLESVIGLEQEEKKDKGGSWWEVYNIESATARRIEDSSEKRDNEPKPKIKIVKPEKTGIPLIIAGKYAQQKLKRYSESSPSPEDDGNSKSPEPFSKCADQQSGDDRGENDDLIKDECDKVDSLVKQACRERAEHVLEQTVQELNTSKSGAFDLVLSSSKERVDTKVSEQWSNVTPDNLVTGKADESATIVSNDNTVNGDIFIAYDQSVDPEMAYHDNTRTNVQGEQSTKNQYKTDLVALNSVPFENESALVISDGVLDKRTPQAQDCAFQDSLSVLPLHQPTNNANYSVPDSITVDDSSKQQSLHSACLESANQMQTYYTSAQVRVDLKTQTYAIAGQYSESRSSVEENENDGCDRSLQAAHHDGHYVLDNVNNNNNNNDVKGQDWTKADVAILAPLDIPASKGEEGESPQVPDEEKNRRRIDLDVGGSSLRCSAKFVVVSSTCNSASTSTVTCTTPTTNADIALTKGVVQKSDERGFSSSTPESTTFDTDNTTTSTIGTHNNNIDTIECSPLTNSYSVSTFDDKREESADVFHFSGNSDSERRNTTNDNHKSGVNYACETRADSTPSKENLCGDAFDQLCEEFTAVLNISDSDENSVHFSSDSAEEDNQLEQGNSEVNKVTPVFAHKASEESISENKATEKACSQYFDSVSENVSDRLISGDTLLTSPIVEDVAEVDKRQLEILSSHAGLNEDNEVQVVEDEIKSHQIESSFNQNKASTFNPDNKEKENKETDEREDSQEKVDSDLDMEWTFIDPRHDHAAIDTTASFSGDGWTEGVGNDGGIQSPRIVKVLATAQLPDNKRITDVETETRRIEEQRSRDQIIPFSHDNNNQVLNFASNKQQMDNSGNIEDGLLQLNTAKPGSYCNENIHHLHHGDNDSSNGLGGSINYSNVTNSGNMRGIGQGSGGFPHDQFEKTNAQYFYNERDGDGERQSAFGFECRDNGNRNSGREQGPLFSHSPSHANVSSAADDRGSDSVGLGLSQQVKKDNIHRKTVEEETVTKTTIERSSITKTSEINTNRRTSGYRSSSKIHNSADNNLPLDPNSNSNGLYDYCEQQVEYITTKSKEVTTTVIQKEEIVKKDRILTQTATPSNSVKPEYTSSFNVFSSVSADQNVSNELCNVNNETPSVRDITTSNSTFPTNSNSDQSSGRVEEACNSDLPPPLPSTPPPDLPSTPPPLPPTPPPSLPYECQYQHAFELELPETSNVNEFSSPHLPQTVNVSDTYNSPIQQISEFNQDTIIIPSSETQFELQTATPEMKWRIGSLFTTSRNSNNNVNTAVKLDNALIEPSIETHKHPHQTRDNNSATNDTTSTSVSFTTVDQLDYQHYEPCSATPTNVIGPTMNNTDTTTTIMKSTSPIAVTHRSPLDQLQEQLSHISSWGAADTFHLSANHPSSLSSTHAGISSNVVYHDHGEATTTTTAIFNVTHEPETYGGEAKEGHINANKNANVLEHSFQSSPADLQMPPPFLSTHKYPPSLSVSSPTSRNENGVETYDNDYDYVTKNDQSKTSSSLNIPRLHHHNLLKSGNNAKTSSLWTLKEETDSLLEAISPISSPKRGFCGTAFVEGILKEFPKDEKFSNDSNNNKNTELFIDESDNNNVTLSSNVPSSSGHAQSQMCWDSSDFDESDGNYSSISTVETSSLRSSNYGREQTPLSDSDCTFPGDSSADKTNYNFDHTRPSSGKLSDGFGSFNEFVSGLNTERITSDWASKSPSESSNNTTNEKKPAIGFGYSIENSPTAFKSSLAFCVNAPLPNQTQFNTTNDYIGDDVSSGNIDTTTSSGMISHSVSKTPFTSRSKRIMPFPVDDVRSSSTNDATSRLNTLDLDLSCISSCASSAPSEHSDASSMFTCHGTAEIKKGHHSVSFDDDCEMVPISNWHIPSSTPRLKPLKSALKKPSQKFDLESGAKSQQISLDNQVSEHREIWIKQFDNILEDFSNKTSILGPNSDFLFVDETTGQPSSHSSQQSALSSQSSPQQSSNINEMYKAFTNNHSEKKQNHLCPVVEDDNINTFRFRRFLKKSHTKRNKGKRIVRFFSRLSCVSESVNSPDLNATRKRAKLDNGDSYGTDFMPELPERGHHQPQPSSSSHVTSKSTLQYRQITSKDSPTSSIHSLDSCPSRTDSAYSSVSESLSGTVGNSRFSSSTPLPSSQYNVSNNNAHSVSFSDDASFLHDSSSLGLDRTPERLFLDSAYSSTSEFNNSSFLRPSTASTSEFGSDPFSPIPDHGSNPKDIMSALSEVFTQLDVCEGEIDTALLDRLQVCAQPAITHRK